MNVLIAYASRHGSTRDIAEVIADELRNDGHRVTAGPAELVLDLLDFDAIVIGSGVYMGHWLPAARAFVERFQSELSGLPVWLFSSGPLGNQAAAAPGDIESLSLLMNVQDHTVFHGSLDPSTLGLAERMVVRLVRAPSGDYRDWNEIRGWSFLIGHELRRRSEHRASG
jgi:menaquinone-dependent protoporphyrinogen oxidase